MKTIKGPGIFLAQFVGDDAPFHTFDAICGWAASLGYKGVQIAAWDGRLIDLKKAAGSKDYCDELKGTAASPRRRDHRTRHPSPGPMRRGQSGL